MRLGRQYAIEARLSGALIRAEGIHRDRVRVSLDQSGETLVGELQTSGSYEGGPSDLLLTAKGLTLHRVGRDIALHR